MLALARDVAILASIALQHGVPLASIRNALAGRDAGPLVLRRLRRPGPGDAAIRSPGQRQPTHPNGRRRSGCARSGGPGSCSPRWGVRRAAPAGKTRNAELPALADLGVTKMQSSRWQKLCSDGRGGLRGRPPTETKPPSCPDGRSVFGPNAPVTRRRVLPRSSPRIRQARRARGIDVPVQVDATAAPLSAHDVRQERTHFCGPAGLRLRRQSPHSIEQVTGLRKDNVHFFDNGDGPARFAEVDRCLPIDLQQGFKLARMSALTSSRRRIQAASARISGIVRRGLCRAGGDRERRNAGQGGPAGRCFRNRTPSDKEFITGRQIAAARALLGLNQPHWPSVQ